MSKTRKQGKPLPDSDLKRLEEQARKLTAARKIQKVRDEMAAAASAERYVATKVELAKLVKMTRRNLDRYLNQPGSPSEVEGKGWPLQAVTKFILDRLRGSHKAAQIDGKMAVLRRNEVAERTRRMKMKNDRDAGLLMPRSHHDAIISGMITALHRVFSALPQKLAVEVVGLTVPEAEIRLAHAINEGWETLRNEGRNETA